MLPEILANFPFRTATSHSWTWFPCGRTTRTFLMSRSYGLFMSKPQVGAFQVRIGEQFGGRAVKTDRTLFHDVGAVRDFERLADILLHQQDCKAVAVEPPDEGE